MLQLEFPPSPLILRFLGQEVDSDVSVGDGIRVSRPVVFT